MKNISLFTELKNRGNVGFVEWLYTLNEKQLYQLQNKHFTGKNIKKDKEKQIDRIIFKIEDILNCGACFSGIYTKIR